MKLSSVVDTCTIKITRFCYIKVTFNLLYNISLTQAESCVVIPLNRLIKILALAFLSLFNVHI